MLVQVEK
ncbi:Protein of unknown function [Escherichia coli D6-113.11]|nr:Protein of unknown function [Escherichia coli D6-113.11]CDU37195.1 Protein of unknown function [Escherichia coli D6-113.11]